MLEYRRQLAETVLERLRSEIPNISANFGEDYETSDEPEAQTYRSIGGKFRWVAFGFAPWRFWDLHVGVVETENDRHSIGFHISERAAAAFMPRLEALASEIGTTVVHQTVAVEYQANLPPLVADERRLDEAADVVVDLCRKFAPVAAAVKNLS